MSSKIKLVYILIGILLLLVSIKASFALQEDFNAYATEKVIYTCSCALSQDKIVVENSGDVTSTYSIKQSGTGADFSSFTEKAFNLEPGESKIITDFIRAPCGIIGEYELKTEFETVFGLKKEFGQKVVVKDCVNVNLMMLEAALPVCPCSPAKYVFRVENTGTFLETYRMGIDSDYAELSEEILILEPQQSKNITVFITTPCGSYGDLEFALAALAERSEMVAELPFVLRVAPCYNYTLEALGQYSVCQDINNLIPVKIKNTAGVKNTYFLDANADWAIFENSSVSLWGGEQKTVNLNVYPVDVEPANYNLTIDSVTARGEIRKSLNLAANVENCYSLNLSSESDYARVVNGESGSVGIYVENDGTRPNEYSLNLTGPEWVKLEAGRVSLDPKTKKEIKLEYDVPANETKSASVLVYANMVDYPEKAMAVEIDLDVVSIEDAYRIEIKTPVKKLESNYDGKTIPVTINNVGIRKGEFELSVYGNNWTSLNTTRITVEPQQSGGIGLVLNPEDENKTPEGKYTATIDALLKGKNIAYSRTFDIKLRQKTLWEKISGFFSDYWLYIVASALGLLMLVAVIAGVIIYRKRHPKEEKKAKEEKLIEEEKPSWLKRTLLLLLILLILAGIGFASYYFAFLPLFGNMTNATNVTVPIPPVEEPEPTPPEPVTNATIFVNRTGLRGYGNIIELVGMENITIPLIIQNSDEPNTYIIRVSENISWVKTDRDVVNIPPSEKRTINIFVTPTPEVEEGNYNLSININIAGREKPISEEIVLSVRKSVPFYEKYMWYLIGGVLALVILLALVRRKEKGEGEEFEELETIEKIRKEKEPRDYSRLKNFLVILILVLVALALIGGMVYVGFKYVPATMKAGNATMNATEEEAEAGPVIEEKEPVGEKAEEEQVPEESYERVFVKKGKETLIPIKISNVNKTTTFRIRVKEDVDWLYSENESVDIGPDENKTINLVASPNATIGDGNYKVTVDIDIADGEKVFSKYFMLKVRKNRFSDLLSYLYYILGGIVALFVLIKILGKRELESQEKPEKKEKGPKKKKTSLKLK